MDQRDKPEYRPQGSSDMAPLSKLTDWQVAQGDPDIRGWDVIDQDGNSVGKVDDLIINTRSGEAQYADVSYGGSLGIGAKHTLIPIDDLRLNTDRKQVVSRYPMEALKEAPEYKQDTSDYGSFGSFWAGVAAMEARRHPSEQQQQPSQQHEGVVQRFVQRMEGKKPEEQQPQQGQYEEKRKVRVHLAHRTSSGDEVPLHEGDVLELPVTGESQGRRTTMLEEIVIRLEAVEIEDEDRGEGRRFHV